jgi:hypothetical protein
MSGISARRWLGISAGLLTLALLAATWSLHRSAEQAVREAQAPPRIGMALPETPVPDSLLLLPITLEASAFDQIAKGLPERIAIPARTHRKKFRIGSVSIDTEGEIWLSSTRIRAQDDALWITTDADARLDAYLAGRRQSVQGTAAIEARVSLQLRADWSLEPTVELHYHWLREPSTRLFGVDIGLRRQADRALQPKLAELEQRWTETIKTRINVQQRVQALWTRLQQPLPISTEPPLWLRIEPGKLYWRGPTSSGDALQFQLGVQCRLQLVHGTAPTPGAATPLPTLSIDALPEPRVLLNLDIQADYAAMTQVLQTALGGQSRQFDYPGGSAKVSFDEFRVYPSAPDLVLGAKLRVEGSGIPDSSGWVYLRGRPGFDTGSEELYVDGLDFASVSQDSMVQLLSTLLRGQIREQLAASARIDLSQRLAQLRGNVQEQLDRLVELVLDGKQVDAKARTLLAGHLQLHGKLGELSVDSVVPAESALALRVAVRGELSLQMH